MIKILGLCVWMIIIHAPARVGTGLHWTNLVSAHRPALEDWNFVWGGEGAGGRAG